MPNEENHFTNQDREILITLKTQVFRLIEDVKNTTNNFVEKTEHKNLVIRVDKLESNNLWVVRVIIGVIIISLLGLIIISK